MRIRQHSLPLIVFLITSFGVRASALEPEDGSVFLRVIDTGPGLACVVAMPGDHFMIFDAGHWQGGGELAFQKIREVIPDGATIDLMVLSHSDADHLGAVGQIIDTYNIQQIIRSGHSRTTNTWQNADRAIEAAEENGTFVIDLGQNEFPAGATYRYGETFVTMVAGFHSPPTEWGTLNTSERRNAGSIVIRLQYRGSSILLTGDAVGRHIGDPANALIATENFMVQNASVIRIDSDVLVAPHHGADNGSSAQFIAAVNPDFVIFSAGHNHEHPRQRTAQRYLDADVAITSMFRTDRGDDEGGDEWRHGRIDDHSDPRGDDDVDVLLRSNQTIVVEYRNS